MFQQRHSETAIAGGQLSLSRHNSKNCFGHEWSYLAPGMGALRNGVTVDAVVDVA
jgi:hypothetical protein